MANELTIADQARTIEDLNKELTVFQSLFASKIDMDRFKREVTAQITEVVTCNINGFQDCQSQFKGLFNSLREDLTKSKESIEKKFMDLIDKIERNFNVTKIDREGVLKEIRIWEKTIFIIEKKLENIYTLIERINTKGETCHKPE
jgi:archaellum component FlaC